MREFITAAQDIENDVEESPNEFNLDGVLCRFFKPQDGQVAVLIASTGRHSSEHEKIAAYINFFVGVLDDDTHQYIVGRLLDRKDKFGLEQVQEINEHMMEVWSGRPTQPSSVSTRSQSSGGRKSKATTPALTS